MRHIIVSFFVVLSLLSASCSSKLPTLKPYKMDIQQGNVVTSKMMLQLRPGMTKSQVRFIMGTPLIQDSFHNNRWDYFYQMRKAGKIVEQRLVILDFEKDALVRVRGDVIPAGTGDGVVEPTTGTEPVSQPEDNRSLIDKLKFWKKDDKKQPEPQKAPTELVNPEAKPPATEAEPAKAAEPTQDEAPAKAAEPTSTEQPATSEDVPSIIAIPPGQQSEPTLDSITPEPAPATESKPEPEPEPVPAPQPVLPPEPVTDPAEPAPQMPAPKVEEPIAAPTPEPASAPPTETPAPQPVPEPAPAVESEPPAKPPAKPAEEQIAKPAEKPVEKSEPVVKPQESKPAETATEKEPPKEDEPGYFEYMLEKIGF